MPTIQSELTPNGLKRTQTAWMKNCTCRGGGLQPRPGVKKLARVAAPGVGLYQGGWLYDASAVDSANQPYLMLSVAGRILQVRVDTDNSVVDLSTVSGLTNPSTVPQGFMCQGEEFLVIQAGDYTTLPLFWDGAAMRRSVGVLNTSALPGATFVVPAIGAPVLVTLTSPYGGVLNQPFTIGGYHYIQVDPNQCYTVQGSTFNAADAGKTFNVIAGTVWADTPDAKFLIDFTATCGLALPYSFPLTTVYCESTGLNVAPYGPITIPGVVGHVIATFVATPLAPLGPNQIYLLNIDDPRATTAVALPAGGSELPAAGPMDYYMGRLWYAQNRIYSAGDVVGGLSGTAIYQYRDSILAVTENPLALGGDGFAVPTNAGDIRALTHPASIDAAMGEGRLSIFTQKSVYQLSVPVTRDDWIAAGSNNIPLQTEVQRTNGTFGDRAVVSENGDLFYPSTDGIRALITAMRFFGQWGNTPISNNVQRVLDFNDNALMKYASGIVFDNRLLMTCLPIQTPVGVAFQGVVPLDFDIISSLQEKLPPAWEGMWEPFNTLQMFEGDFGGHHRSFAVVAAADGGIDVWEVTVEDKSDNAPLESAGTDNPITWYFELPAYTAGKEFDLKQLDGGELWIDRVSGCVDVRVQYRPDGNPCWQDWHKTSLCSRRNTCEDPDNPVCYPTSTEYQEGYKFAIALPTPPYPKCDPMNSRPVNQGYQFQAKITITGFCRVRGVLLYFLTRERAPFEGLK